MKKLLLIVVAILGMSTTQSQELSVRGNYILAQEHIGEDIKEGAGVTVNAKFDFLKNVKGGLEFGPSVSLHNLGTLKADVETLNQEIDISYGLMTGYDFGRFSIASSIELPLTGNKNMDEGAFFESVVNGSMKYKFKEGGHTGILLSYDYFINKHIFHYTSQVGLGLFVKF